MKYLWMGTFALAVFVQAAPLRAQEHRDKKEHREEKIILRTDGDKQVIEIKNGEIWVNDEKMASTDDKNTNTKIVIENGPEAEKAPPPPSWGFGDEEAPAPARKAMLGVMTNPQKSKGGAYVEQVTPNSPAEKLGLKEGDLITKVDHEPVNDARELIEAVRRHEPGEKIAITYQRDGKTRNGDVALDKMAEQEPMAGMFRFGPEMGNGDIPNLLRSFPFNAGENPFDSGPKLGISAEERADGSGVTVLDVKPGSPAAKAGLQENDVVLKLGDEKVGSVDELQAALRQTTPNEKTRLEYQRNGKKMSTDIVLPKALRKKDL